MIKFELSEELMKQILDVLKKAYNWMKEIFRSIMRPVVKWVEENSNLVNEILLYQRKYLKYKKRVKNRQALYMRRKRIYGK